MRLQHFNVEPQCTPTRSAFMTGRRPIRSGITRVVWGMLYGMTSWEVTMAELFSEAGYATGVFGKRHIGDVRGRLPADQGFDEWYGVAARREIDAELARGAIEFMARSANSDKPFFAFVPFTQPHLPTLPHPDFDGRTGNGHYADVYGNKWRNWKTLTQEPPIALGTPDPYQPASP